MSDHREAAEEALANAQRNPIMSAAEHFAVAQVHALLAIEQRLGELVVQRGVLAPKANPLLPSGSV